MATCVPLDSLSELNAGVAYRSLLPDDRESLQARDWQLEARPRPATHPGGGGRPQPQALHNELFPIVYEAEFFRKAVFGLDGISSHAAVDCVNGRLVGFITARTTSVSEADDTVRAHACSAVSLPKQAAPLVCGSRVTTPTLPAQSESCRRAGPGPAVRGFLRRSRARQKHDVYHDAGCGSAVPEAWDCRLAPGARGG